MTPGEQADVFHDTYLLDFDDDALQESAHAAFKTAIADATLVE